MGDSQQGNNKGKGKEKENYESWTMDDTNELLHLLVDAINSGLRDANGSLSKQNVERLILPRLNAKIRFPKTYNNYLNRMKWFKKQYNKMSTLMRNNSGFGWDPIAKMFTASDEVWKDYLKSHPSLIRESTRFYPDFKDCIGAIDGTHIPAMVRGRDVRSYRNRHGKISQNVLAACNFDLEFMYVLSGWEGSAHDSKLLNNVCFGTLDFGLEC
ncbi:hypothetical protein CerSpe_261930 [Prunus speciosa]